MIPRLSMATSSKSETIWAQPMSRSGTGMTTRSYGRRNTGRVVSHGRPCSPRGTDPPTTLSLLGDDLNEPVRILAGGAWGIVPDFDPYLFERRFGAGTAD